MEMASAASRTILLLVGVIFGLMPHPTVGHLCIISPHQRGPLDVSHSGSHTCFRHGAPCGGISPQQPLTTYIGGSTIFVTFQQNYNHYEVGYPGYMDIALATSSSPDAHFEIVGVFGDVNEHAQDHQQNYSLPVDLPDIDCSNCVLRGRYVAHKPGERTFYQCSDIIIKSSRAVKATELQRNQVYRPQGHTEPIRPPSVPAAKIPRFLRAGPYAPLLYGFAWDPEKSGSVFVTVNTVTGEKQKISPMYFGLGSGIQYGTPSPMAQSNKYVMDQIACFDREMPYLNLLEHRNGGLDAVPNKLLWIDMVTREIAGEYELDTPNHLPIISLVPYLRQLYLAVQIKEMYPQSENFTFLYGTLSYMGHFEQILNTSQTPEHDYVNYLWATLNYKTKVHYMLIGNENSPDALKAKIYTLNVASKDLTVRQLDVSEYTISAIQVYEKTGELFAMSPGLFGKPYPAWTLVTVDPSTGAIKKKYPVAPAGVFQQYYGGTVFNIDQDSGVLYYVLRIANSRSDVIASVCLDTGKVTFSRLTDLRNIYNLAFYKN
ncbi:uncharacterized protein LOC110983045 [Acanthaster planci]|uniref:Uncharacterized protein LOC110983045 n=1 Tax=Acanthaster planci TaxID=133434 RepID=A0A8B7YY52_ACAPL|nr:uncharacterized protein LOC110983045 [Acanthaster planci]